MKTSQGTKSYFMSFEFWNRLWICDIQTSNQNEARIAPGRTLNPSGTPASVNIHTSSIRFTFAATFIYREANNNPLWHHLDFGGPKLYPCASIATMKMHSPEFGCRFFCTAIGAFVHPRSHSIPFSSIRPYLSKPRTVAHIVAAIWLPTHLVAAADCGQYKAKL